MQDLSLWCTGLVAPQLMRSQCESRVLVPRPGIEPKSPALEVESFHLDHQGSLRPVPFRMTACLERAEEREGTARRTEFTSLRAQLGLGHMAVCSHREAISFPSCSQQESRNKLTVISQKCFASCGHSHSIYRETWHKLSHLLVSEEGTVRTNHQPQRGPHREGFEAGARRQGSIVKICYLTC